MMRRVLIGSLSVGVLALTAWMHAAAPATVVEAAMTGNRDSVRALLKDGADVNSAQADGMTALHWAAGKNDVDLARLLLVAGANLKATTRIGGYTPLLIASRSGHVDMVTALLGAGADPNLATANGATPLMFAAQAGNVATVNALLAGGADVNAAEKVKGETALFFAAAYGRADVIRALTAKGASVGVKTKVMDLDAFNKEETAREEQFRQQQAQAAAAEAARAGRPAPAAQQGRGRGNPNAKPGIDRQYNYTELVGYWGGLTPLHLAARQGEVDAATALIDAGADLNDRTAGDNVTPMLIATINGHFDLTKHLLDKGADPNAAAVNGVTTMYAALNCQWAAKALYPQPRAYEQQQTTYLALMKALLDKGADPNVRLTRKVWYAQYDFDQSGIDEAGATPFWRAAYASDVDAMKLLVQYGADPTIPTMRTPGRPRTGDAVREAQDVSGLPPVSVGGPGVAPLLAASGEGYGEGLAANHHRYAPAGMLPAVKYLVEVLHVDVNVRDHEGNNAIHNAAARGDNEMIQYLVSKGADPLVVNREGKTTVDMANGPVQRITPFPETIKLLEGMGAKNNHKCVGC
ncbi:MAG: ankyrin repeat domain-containing protein [Acidobacteria bacterium]|nr:ankyrin repeat domain-containing protein [Acidobacteriota bacterium]